MTTESTHVESARPARKVPRALRLGIALLIFVIASWFIFLPTSPPPFNVNDKSVGSRTVSSVRVVTPWGDSTDAELFRLVVLENRNRPDGNRIELAVQRLRTSSPDPLPPVFVLAGGPGSSGIRLGQTEYFYLFSEIRKRADVVLVDQRGTGISIPSLQIPGELDLPTDIRENVDQRVKEALHARLTEAIRYFQDGGIDLTAYNSVENANDIDEIRQSLGYETITLMGYSYGTELSMVYTDRYPDRVHNGVWLGPQAPDMALKLPGQVQMQFEGMERLIAADKRMKKLIPDFTGLMKSVHTSLAATPVDIRVPLMDAVSDDDPAFLRGIFSIFAFFKPNWEMIMGDLHLQLIVQDYIGHDFWLGRLPAFYYKISNGEYNRVGNILRNFRRRSMPNALILTTNCATGYTDHRMQIALEQESATALSVLGLSFGRSREFCEPCGLLRLGDEFLTPITSDRPVLFVAGTLDGRTSFDNLTELRRRFRNSEAIIVENAGHNQLLDNIIRDGILAFLEGNKPSITHVKRSIEFDAPVPYRHSIQAALDSVFTASGRDAAKEFFREVRRQHLDDEEYLYDVSEAALNSYGYALLGQARAEEAVAIFELNAELHPESWNVYDSLGEGLKALGRFDEAKKTYDRSIEMNFLNGNGRMHLREMGFHGGIQ